MGTPTTGLFTPSVIRNPKTWIAFSILILFLVGVAVQRIFSGPSPSLALSANTWTPIGPAPGAGPFSGRVDVAASVPNNSSIMYVGANVGGIWKTTNWLDASPIWTEISNQPQILSLAIHEHDLVVFNSNIVLAAAFLAAADGGPLGMSHMIRATRREFQKLGRMVTETEFGPHIGLLNRDGPV